MPHGEPCNDDDNGQDNDYDIHDDNAWVYAYAYAICVLQHFSLHAYSTVGHGIVRRVNRTHDLQKSLFVCGVWSSSSEASGNLRANSTLARVTTTRQ